MRGGNAVEDQGYERMYCEMARAVEKAIRILVEVQQKCEELYISRGGEGPEGE